MHVNTHRMGTRTHLHAGATCLQAGSRIPRATPPLHTCPPVSRSNWAVCMGAAVEGPGRQEGGGGGRRLFVGGISKGVRESELAAAFEPVRARVRVDRCVHVHACIHVRCIHVRVCTCTHAHACLHVHSCMYAHTLSHMYTHITGAYRSYVSVHVHTHTHTHTHTQYGGVQEVELFESRGFAFITMCSISGADAAAAAPPIAGLFRCLNVTKETLCGVCVCVCVCVCAMYAPS